MSSDLDRVFDGIIGMLNESVIPNLTDEVTRGQVFATIYALSELKVRTDWSADWLRRHLDIQLAAFAAAGEGGDDLPPPPFVEVPLGLSPSELAEMRDAGDAWLCAAQGWIDRTGASPGRDQVDRAAVDAILAQTYLEMQLTPKPMYSKVAKG